MTHVRLLPTLLIAITGLLGIKLTHILAENGDVLGGVQPAIAQEAQEKAEEPAKDKAAESKEGSEAAKADGEKAKDSKKEQEPPALVEGVKVNQNSTSRSEMALYGRLAERSKELDAREAKIEQQLILLKAAEKNAKKRVEELRALKNSIELATRKRREQQKEDLGKLVAMYQTMKPKQAARIFEVLDNDVLLDIVKIMNPRKVAAILGQMKASSAGALSLAMARGKTLESEVKLQQGNELPQIGN